MTIFLILAPFGSFALLMLVTSAEISLFASAAICLAVIGIDVYRGRSIKMLGAGSVVVFTGTWRLCHADRSEPEQFGRQACGRCRRARDLAGVADHPQAVRAAICARGGRCRDGKAARLHEGDLHHHLGLDRRLRADDHRQRADDLCAGLAALVRTGDRLRRPQQCRLFHDMVSTISQGEVWCRRRRTPCPAPTKIIFEPKHHQQRARR